MDRVKATELVRQAEAAARVGELAEARRLLRKATELAPDNVETWLDLAGVVESPEEKRACFQRVLALDPDNGEAKVGLEWIERMVGAAPVSDPPETVVVSAPAQAMEVAERPIRKPEAILSPPAPDHAEPEILYCANHPDTETLLRCNRCNKPICLRCAVRTPVGYRCRECVSGQRALYYTGVVGDYPIAAVVSLVLFGVAGFLFSVLGRGFFGFWIAILLGPAVGGGIAEAVRSAVRRRRSRYLGLIAMAGAILGGAIGPGLALGIAAVVQGAPLTTLIVAPLAFVFRLDLVLFIGLSAATVYARLR
ncbi:MAG: tetratricopeptide repeat protein [Anaerolineae bacterium]|nr:tetratricopeptide repeat protein [Anaerolineae bacterium]